MREGGSGFAPSRRWPTWVQGPGAGGRWKVRPEDFVVEELPLAPPEGDGEHLHLTVTKTGWSTLELARWLAQAAGVSPERVGYAGLKDTEAVTTQAFTVLTPGRIDAPLPDGVTLVEERRCRQKLRPGQLAGNRFAVRVRGCDRAALLRRKKILERIGAPNYFGEQRVGGSAPARGYALLCGERLPMEEPERKFALSAWQALLFNHALAARGQRDLNGDLLLDGTPTGPMFGHEMPWPSGEALALERAILADAHLPPGALSRFPTLTRGARRAVRLSVSLDVTPTEDGAWLAFTLPPGAFATSILEELL